MISVASFPCFAFEAPVTSLIAALPLRFQSSLLTLLRGLPSVQKLPPHDFLPEAQIPAPKSFVSFFIFGLTSFWRDWLASLEVWVIQKVFCGCSTCSFLYICQGRRWSPCIITLLSWSRNLILNIGLQGETYISLCLWDVNVLPDLPRAFCVCIYVCFENLTSAILLFGVNSLDFILVTFSPTLLWGNLLCLIGWNHC